MYEIGEIALEKIVANQKLLDSLNFPNINFPTLGGIDAMEKWLRRLADVN